MDVDCGRVQGFVSHKGFLEEEFQVEGIMSCRLNPILMSSRADRDWREVSNSLKPSLSFWMVNLATILWLAALMIQQSCLYFEISIPTK